MRCWILSLLLFLAVSASVGDVATAATRRATTAQLPPALLQLGVEEARILSQQQAQAVRGQWFMRLLIVDPFGSGGFLLYTAHGEGSLNTSIATQRVNVNFQIGR